MRPSSRFLHACRITFFTRSNCSLCHNAKLVLSKVWDQRPFDYVEVAVMEAQHQKWQMYQFDTPVIHVDKTVPAMHETTAAARKLMHRFNEEQVLQLMHEVEKTS
ncbi:putative glutaredoxin domain-containing protein [Venturia nashicola]|uniref:Glutaredoxin-like protein n=1 Tax=Venturia nashicola TaxID=86259 RepID=A0A4Z1P5K6_9PEZI|nr:putative glutaredoxin domain-containing protein [Venturia nashicola]TLD34898.1 putative glutaredoxin domain-containing protein [Venturia nashicola]